MDLVKKARRIIQILCLPLVVIFFARLLHGWYIWYQLGEVSGFNDAFSGKLTRGEPVPLSIAELTEYSDEDYSLLVIRDFEGDRKYFEFTFTADPSAQMEEGQPETLVYTISTGPADCIAEYIEKVAADLQRSGDAVEIDVAPWRGDMGFYAAAQGEHRYLLCWETKTIEVVFDWQPTEEQVNAAVEELQKYDTSR